MVPEGLHPRPDLLTLWTSNRVRALGSNQEARTPLVEREYGKLKHEGENIEEQKGCGPLKATQPDVLEEERVLGEE
jgi:hypothetical protein